MFDTIFDLINFPCPASVVRRVRGFFMHPSGVSNMLINNIYDSPTRENKGNKGFEKHLKENQIADNNKKI